MRAALSLPDGYRVREIQGYLYLFDPRGVPLVGPTDAGAIETYAWRDAWRQIDRELNEELADLRAGIRPLHRLPRMRQYMRMMDAVAQARAASEGGRADAAERPVRVRAFGGVVRWGAVAAAAAAAAMLFFFASSMLPEFRGARAPVATTARPAVLVAKRPALPRPVAPERVQVATARRPEATRVAQAGSRRPTRVEYAVSFGEFTRDASADSMMHYIRSKGYVVSVSAAGTDSRVVTPPFRTRAEAARLVNALQQIGLPAQLTTARVL